MNYKFKKTFLTTLLGIMMLGIFVLPAVATAQQAADLGLQYAQGTGLSTTDIRVTIANIIRIFLGLLGIVAVGLMLYGGVTWMTSGGEAAKIDKAKKIIINAAIGLVIIVSAFGIAQFALSNLQSATTNGGSGQNGSGNNGGGIGGSGGSGSTAFKSDSILPKGIISIRNVVVQISFNDNVDFASASPTNIKVTKKSDGSVVAGKLFIINNVVNFVPDANCPAPNTSLKCFDQDTEFQVQLTGGKNGVLSASNPKKPLTCTFGSVCQVSFKTGALIDTNDPTITMTNPLDGLSVPANSQVLLQSIAKDDAGVGIVQFKVQSPGSSINFLQPSLIPKTNTTSFNAQMGWDTTGLALLSTHSISADVTDLAKNTGTSAAVNITVRAEHCFNTDTQGNPLQDIDETGPNCGGADCAACSGSACTQNNQCSGGACIGGICRDLPVILTFSPEEGAPENFITIVGSSFGKYDNTKSKVSFIDKAGVKTSLAMPAQCSGAWSDGQIIVEVPKAFTDGDYDIEVTTANTCDAQGTLCADDTTNNRGIQKQFKVDKLKTYPSLCNATPSAGQFNTTFDLVGKNLGSTSGEVFVGSFKANITGVWSDKKIAQVVVPNLTPGTLPVSIQNNNKTSNAVNFRINQTQDVPFITNISPDNGNITQYITISGNDFGINPGTVYFYDSALAGGRVQGDTNFPQACGNQWWTDSKIRIKVPNIVAKQYKIGITNAITNSNQVDFLRNNNNITPGLCAITPIQGPVNTPVTLIGEGFGSLSGKVRFLKVDVQGNAISTWADQIITTSVPSLSNTGQVPVRVINPSSTLSNAIDFTIGSCKSNNNTCSIAGFNCCGDGTCQLQCPAVPQLRTFTWKFSTGILPPPVIVPAPQEVQNCSQSQLQSPSPWKDSKDACVDARISVVFNTVMESATFTITGQNANIKVFKCTDRQNCTGQPLTIQSVTSLKNSQSEVEGFVLDLTTVLDKDTWYQVQLVGKQNGIASDKQVAMTSDYIWHFKTRNSTSACTIDKVFVNPASSVIDVKNGLLDLEAIPLAQNCNVLDATKFQWKWTTTDSSKVDFIATQPALPINKKQVVGKVETSINNPIKIEAEEPVSKVKGSSTVTVDFRDPFVSNFWPNCTKSCVNAAIGAEFNTVMNTSSFIGAVKLYECANENCFAKDGFKLINPLTNQALQPQFNTITTNGVTKHILNIPAPNLKPQAFYIVVLDDAIRTTSDVFLTKLNFDQDGDKKFDAYAWKFSTKNDSTPCTASLVQVNPITSVIGRIGAKQEYFSQPIGSPDQCNPSGQLLNAYSYDWSWTPTGQSDAIVTNFRYHPNPPQACSSQCLALGSTEPPAICGNGKLEIGEDCDDGNIKNGDSCSATCLREGNVKTTCGDGVIDKQAGEECDEGIKAKFCAGGVNNTKSCLVDSDCKGDATSNPVVQDGKCLITEINGCTTQCLNAGSISGASICGNNSIGQGEDCDDGNLIDGDSCSSQCLNEGSPTLGSIAVCGNNIVEAGESCDDGNQIIGDGCGSQCLKEGTIAPLCGNNQIDAGEDCDGTVGCSNRCLNLGSSFEYNSFCGNGIVEAGEDSACELSPLPAAAKGSPYQWAEAKNFSPIAGQTSSKIEIKVSESTGSNGKADLYLQCGYVTDAQCGASATSGRATNTCCYNRPKVQKQGNIDVYPVDDITGNKSVCTNTLIQIPFDQELSSSALTGNILLAEAVKGNCPANTSTIALVDNQLVLESESAGWWTRTKNFIVGLFVDDANAALPLPSGLTNWCSSSIKLTSELDSSGKIISIQYNEFLKNNTYYRIVVLGDSNLTDATVEGITSVNGVGYNGPTAVTVDGKTNNNSYSWVFKTGTPCLLAAVEIENTDGSKDPFMFRSSESPENTRNYKAIAIDANRQPIQSVPGTYTWEWNWKTNPSDLFSQVVSGTPITNLNKVTSSGVSGKGSLTAEAYIKNSPFGAQNQTCSTKGECSSDICLSDVNNSVCSASSNSCGTQLKPTGHCAVTEQRSEALTSFICDNPWPTQNVSADGKYNDTTFNFSVLYCRDAGNGKVCHRGDNHGSSCNSNAECSAGGGVCQQDISDDLPTIPNAPIVRTILGKVCDKTNLSCSNSAGLSACTTAGGTCKETDLLAEYLFVLQSEQKTCHDKSGTTKGTVCNIDSDCLATEEFCYADPGKSFSSTNDAIGIRVMKNDKHISPSMWYTDVIKGQSIPSSLSSVDGYTAIQEGRTVYVNAVNTQDNISKGFFTNIYLMSYNQNALAPTIEVFKRMMKYWTFNTNLSPTNKTLAQNDTRRLEDLNYIDKLVNDYFNINRVYPELKGGTFEVGQTYSTWPSWQRTLGAFLGTTLPIDPINKFKKCSDSKFNEKTCWDGKTFDEANLLDAAKKLKEGSYVYQYYTRDGGKTYSLDFNIEYLGLATQQGPVGGKADECYDESPGIEKWVSSGEYHTTRKKFKNLCILGSWRDSCGNGVFDDAQKSGEKCDGSNINYCDAKNNIDRDWNNEIVQVCTSQCELERTSTDLDTNHQCGGYCGDSTLNGNEVCEFDVASQKFTMKQPEPSCSSLGWGSQGKVGCNPTQCGYYGGGCVNGPLTSGDIRVKLEWARKTVNGSVDLDLHLLVPYQNEDIAPYGNPGDISSQPYAWGTKDDTNANLGTDIDGDGQPDGLELITIRKIPGTNEYNNGIYSLYVRSYNGATCFNTSCKDIQIVISQVGQPQQIFKLSDAIGYSTTGLGTYWHVYDMDKAGLITPVQEIFNNTPVHK